MIRARVAQSIRECFGRFRTAVTTFAAAREGATAILLAVAMPAIAGVVGFAVDYSSISGNKSRLQAVVDSTAIAIAREMTISPVATTRAQSLAEQYVAANIPANTPYKITVTASLVENNFAVKIDGQQSIATPFGTMERFVGVSTIFATALARVTAASTPTKTCMISLGQDSNGGIYMHNGAMITAPGCILHSNSTRKNAIILSQGSSIRTQLLCARGGVKNMASSVEATIVTDCPAMKDPLANKPEPKPPLLCNTAPKKISQGLLTLKPGLYCGGIDITGTAKVTLTPGVYFFRGGPLRVTQSAEFVGKGVTLMFLDNKAYFRFLGNSLIQLSAPVSGITAGMLLWEAAAIIPVVSPLVGGVATSTLAKTKKTTENHINSDRARELTGTIYLRKGLLLIDSTRPIADLSPYTIMVVEKLDLFDGPNLILNSNYNNSTVPVPSGLGPIGGSQVRLGQ